MLTHENKLSLKAGTNILLGDLVHPNKMPFSGLMTWFNRPSDKAVGGAGGKKVIVPAEYGVSALATLKGMAVNMDSIFMDKHVTTHKIGIIEEVEVGEPEEDGGIPVYVSGFIYAHDFPDEAIDIRANQSDLGFSYETIDTPVVDGIYGGESVLVVNGDVVFSGAAILLKSKGAYTNTSLAAQANENTGMEEMNVNMEEMVVAVVTALEAKYNLQAKEAIVEEVNEVVEEVVVEEVKTEEVVTEPVTETVVVEEGVVADPVVETVVEETIDFKAMAEDYKTQIEDVKAELDMLKADLKAEVDAKEANTHKGFAFPLTLMAKYDLQAEADSYEEKLAKIDAKEGLSVDEKMALKFEVRAAHLKAQK